jgi:uncharacterized phage-associated protein
MKLRFNEEKAMQAAAKLLELRGGKMSYMKLLKLLYIVDREALRRWGRPVTTDSYVSMDRGPVPSKTLSLISEGSPPGQTSKWAEFISEPEHYHVHLLKTPASDELSDAEIALIEEVFKKLGSLNRWQLVEHVHTFPEWENPGGSSVPISYRDILKAVGKSELEIAAIESDIDNLALTDTLLGSR